MTDLAKLADAIDPRVNKDALTNTGWMMLSATTCLAASDALRERAWRPISELPHIHGKRVLTWSPDVGELICEWFDGKGIVRTWDQVRHEYATHWQPIIPPTPPEER